MSTVKVPASVPDPVHDAETLRKAFEGWGTNEKLIIEILGHRTAAQRKAIRESYNQLFQEDFLKRLRSETTRDFEKALLLWSLEPAERDAILTHEAIKKHHPESTVIVEISCTRTSTELLNARKAYHQLYKKSIEEDIAANIKGNYGKLLVGLVSSFRYEGPEVDMHLAKSEAKVLHDAIKDKAFDHEDVIRILTTRSKTQLNATFNQYRDEYGHEITKALEEGGQKDFRSTMRAVVKCISCPEMYFVETLRLALDKLGTDEEALLRVVVTRAEVDMQIIKDEYYKITSKTLEHAIAADTHGDYEDFLLALLGKE
eukprot:TRINITY_DN656_c0_g1_i1.p1 TRINITY_DN656_c0_g1~~TRINITY_DN656_c0_g1_i1.p1  ORF type:complete len:315 (+),score=55.67 TRINITY_DN656_c0_g1_i1:240-1184(+)